MGRIGRIVAVIVVAGWAAARCPAQMLPPPQDAVPDLSYEHNSASWPAGSVETSLAGDAATRPRGLAPWVAEHISDWSPPWPPRVFDGLGLVPSRVASGLEPMPPQPHRGWGNPLTGTSWRNRPWSVGAFFGGLRGDDITAGVEQETGLSGGVRLGYDFGHYWGGEVRFTQTEFDVQAGAAEHSGDEWLLDANWLLYPWGDAQWRPFLSLGVGVSKLHFEDATGRSHRETLFQFPLGVGVKYLFDRWLALRADVTHHFLVGDAGVDSRDNLSATAGVEIHFGAWPRFYYPW